MSPFLPLIMFALLIFLLIVGMPIVYALSAVSLGVAITLWGFGSIFAILTSTVTTMMNWNLLATPLFCFMSLMLFESGVVEDLYEAFYSWTAGLRGGLAMATVFVGALMGAMTGVVAGTVTALTVISLPQMLKYKYDDKIAMGSVLSGGTLGQLIPPSTNMIVYGTITSVSVGGLFAGGMSAGIVLALLYCGYIAIRCAFNKDLCPVMPMEDRKTLKENIIGLKKIFWPCLLILLVLGAIYGGIATPTEAAAVGCVGATVIAILNGRFTFKRLLSASMGTLRNIAMVGWITLAASYFGAVFVAIGGNKFVAELAAMIPGGSYGLVITLLTIIFFLGMFLDPIAIIVICAPIFTPLITGAGIDPLHFAICLMVALQCGYLTPPFGFSLFYMKNAAGGAKELAHIELKEIYKAAIPFVAVQLIGLTLCIFVPSLTMWGLKLM